jgi:NADH dehydrogenase/NADH:ubiquinone oxidoreductase subunit G
MIQLTIDDQKIEVTKERTLLEACREHNIHIPTLCYHPAVEPFGACRLCMVEVSHPSRPPKLVAACVHPCQEGAQVRTNTDSVLASRRMVVELLLASAHQDLELLALAAELDVKEVRFRLPEKDACVLCGLCVRACEEIVGIGAISMINRGISKEVSPPFMRTSPTCIGCGTCVLICPTGVIKLKDVISRESHYHVDLDDHIAWCRLCGDLQIPMDAEIPEEEFGYVFLE